MKKVINFMKKIALSIGIALICTLFIPLFVINRFGNKKQNDRD